MPKPLRKWELRMLWLLFAITLATTAAWGVMYSRIPAPLPLPEKRLKTEGKTIEQRAIAVAEFSNRVAFHAIQNSKINAMRDRAFQSAKWSLIIAALFGSLIWRLRGVKAV